MSLPRAIDWTAGTVALLLVLAGVLGGADQPGPLRYRRVFVPHSDLDQQIRGLLPLKRSEFEHRIGQAAAQGNERQDNEPEAVHIQRALYRARVAGEALVQGRAELTVASTRDVPALLRLDPCNLAIGPALWQESPPRAAQVGNGPGGRFACVVPRSGQLEFDWTLAGRRSELGELTFDLHLPAAPINRLEIELPTGLELTTQQGLATRLGSSPEAGAPTTWLVEAGGARQVTLQVTQPAARPRTQPLVLIQENTSYAVHQATIDVETSLQLDILHQPLSQLVLRLDEPLQLTQVRLGEQLLPWAPLPSPGDQRQIVVHFAQPIAGEGIEVQLSGVVLWASQSRFRLPRFHVDAGTWQEGRVTLAAPTDLQLEAAPQGGGWQTAFSPATSARPQEEWQFQFYLADAGIEIAAAQAPPPLTEQSGAAFRFQATQVQATLTAELSAVGTPVFDVEALVPRAWIVDAIDVRPADMLDDRTLQTRRSGPQVLRLSLRRPIVPGRPLVVAIRAHRRRPASDQPLASDYFTLARFAAVRDARQMVALAAEDPAVQIALSGDESLQRLDPLALSAAERQLFEGGLPGPLLFVADQRADAALVRLLPTSPRYQAQSIVRAEFGPAQLDGHSQVRQSCRLSIIPEDSQVDAVSVRFAPPPPEPIEWSLVGEGARELTARRQQQPTAAPDEAVYELKLQRSRRQPFEIRAEFARPATAATPISLMSLPAAAAQSGLVELHAAAELALSIDARELSAAAPLDRQAAALASLRAVYRYEPGRTGSLRVGTGPQSRALPLAWIESLAGVSRISLDGSADHEVQLVIENVGQRELALELHPTAANLRAQIEGQRLPRRLSRKSTNGYGIPLPDSPGQVIVRLSYSTPPAEFGWWPWGRVPSVLPRPVLPVLTSHWEVQLAPGLDLCTRQSAEAASASGAAQWSAWWPTGAWQRPNPDRQEIVEGDADVPVGWSRHSIPLSSRGEDTLAVYRPAVVSAWAWCLALASAAVVFYSAAGRTAWLLGLAGIAAAASVLLPREWAPLAAGTLVGTALGGGFALLSRRPVAPRRGDRSAANLGSFAAASFSAAKPTSILLALAACATAIGQGPPPATDQPKAPWRRVVIPVDENRQPAGDYVFLEPEMYDALLRLTDRDPAGLPDWLLQGASYQPAIAAPQGGERPEVELVTAEYELETFRADVAIDVGLQRRQIHLAEGRARLDGKAVLTEWSADGGLRVAVPTPGRHRLELAFRPVAAPAADAPLCDVMIPIASQSQVKLPAGSSQMEVVGALGASTVVDGAAAAGGAQRVVQLGPTDRLVLQWMPAAPGLAETAKIEAEQLLLWNVRPGSVVADGNFRIRPLGGQIREVAIELDPRLRVLPLAEAQGVTSHRLEEGSRASTLHLVLKEPASAEFRLRLSLVWTGARGIGSLEFPRVRVRADNPVRDWAAVVLADGLTWKKPPPRGPGDPSLDSFIAAWGAPLPAAAMALNLDERLPPALEVEPDRGRVEVAQDLACSCSLRSVAVHLNARLANVPAHALQHRLQAADGLQISKLQVRSGQRAVRSQWSQSPDGKIVVLLAEPAPAELQFEVEGIAPVGRTTSWPIPLVQYQGAAAIRTQLRIYRQPQTLLTVADVAGWMREIDPDQGHHREGFGRLAATFSQAGAQGASSPQVSVSGNPRELSGVVLARLVSERAGWQLDIRCELEMQSGLLDAVRLELPAPLAGPVEIVPAAQHELTAIAGQTTGRLLVRPQRAVSDRLQLQIKAPLRGGAEAGVVFPSVALLDAPRVRCLLALPRRDGAQRYQWETSGLQTVEPAAAGLPPGWLPAGYELFEGVSPRPTAAAQIRDPALPAAHSLLADHKLQILDDREVVARSTFDVLLGAARSVRLAVPPGRRLIHVSVEGIPAQIVPRGGGQWEVQTADSRLPQRIEVVYAGPLGRPGPGTHELVVCQLVGVRAQQSLWTIGPRALLLPVAGQRPEDSPALVRLESLAAAAHALSLAQVGNLPPVVVRESWAAWEDRVRSAQSQIPARPLPPAAARVKAATERVSAARERLTEAGISLAPPPPRPVPLSAAANLPEGGRHLALAGGFDRVRVSMAAEPAADSNLSHGYISDDARLLWAGGLAACGLLAAGGLARPGIQSWLALHAHFAAAAIGVVWLAVGPAPWLGGVLLALALWRTIQSPWPRAVSHSHSSILRRPNR